VSNNAIVINEDGVYAIYSGKGSRSNNQNSWLQILAVFPDNTLHAIAENFYSGGDASLCTVGCECITLKAGTKLYLRMYGTYSNFTSEQSPLEICKLIQQVPYLIAKKGALVSGANPGEISIDSDTGKMKLIDNWVDITDDYKDHLTSTVFNWYDKNYGTLLAYKYGRMVILNWGGGQTGGNKISLTQPASGGLTVASISKYKPVYTVSALIVVANGVTIMLQLTSGGNFNFTYFSTFAVNAAFPVGQMIYLTND
jgi:hypothetical protein